MSRATRLVSVLLVVILLATMLPLAALASQAPEQAQPGFRAISGAEAQAYRVPSDMTLVAQEDMAQYGLTADRYRQYLGEAEVLGGQLTIYRDAKSGATEAVIGAAYPNLLSTNSVVLSAEQAQAVAATAADRNTQVFTTLMIDPTTGRYFYRVDSRGFDSRWFTWVDAETSAVSNHYDGMAHGSGTGVLGDTKNWTDLTTFSGGTWRMVSANGRLKTNDGLNRTGLPGTLAMDSNDMWDTPGASSPGQPALVDAHFYANVTDTYFQTTHGFNWLVPYSQGMVSTAHYKRNYNNAGWNGTQMVYGDGDGVTFIAFSGDLDVVGHELSHGVTEATSNLIYQNESGALNEAFSDMMGTSIEYSYGTGNWTIGEDITPGTDGIRDMSDPTRDGDPSHYADRYTGTSDNGGVHTNSGIANHWFYLLANGGQNANPARASGTNVQGIGLAAAAGITYLGFTALPASANFCAARAGTIAVAGNSSGNVADAWDEVGVDEALCGGGGGGGNGPVISNVTSTVTNAKRGQFRITWTTDVAADSQVNFTCCGTYGDSSLVTSHSMSFNGTKGLLYEYFVTSTNAGGTSTAGPFTHQN